MNKETILSLISQRQFVQLKTFLGTLNNSDISELLEELSNEDRLIVFRLLNKDEAADVFAKSEPDVQAHIISLLTDTELKDITDNLFMDDMVDLVEELPAQLVKKVLASIDNTKRSYVNELLKYPLDSAGSIMTVEFVDLKQDMSVKESFERIRKVGSNSETIYTCYVIDSSRKLIGVVTVKQLLLADSNELIKDIMESDVISINTNDDKEVVAQMFDKYDFIAMPVVDNENRLVGIVTVDDAIDVINDETQEDFELMSAMVPSEQGYLQTSAFQHAKHRIVWLLVLMLSATITGTIITNYEQAFASVPLLVSFIPMLTDTGGNCGSQSSTLIIRGLATNDLQLKDIFRCLWKETKVSLICGFILGLVNGIRIALMYQNPSIAIVVALSIVVTVILSKLLGVLLPMAAKAVNVDPALMASPVLTTIVDTCSILVYFNIATLILHL